MFFLLANTYCRWICLKWTSSKTVFEFLSSSNLGQMRCCSQFIPKISTWSHVFFLVYMQPWPSWERPDILLPQRHQLEGYATLPETNSSPLKIGHPERKWVIFQPSNETSPAKLGCHESPSQAQALGDLLSRPRKKSGWVLYKTNQSCKLGLWINLCGLDGISGYSMIYMICLILLLSLRDTTQ